MIPYLVTPPASLPVSLVSLKSHLRVAHSDDDDALMERQAAALAVLDGWGGILGRCIMPQVWAVDVTGPGPHVLPLPDASDVEAQVDGEAAEAVDVRPLGLGPEVLVPAAGNGVAVTISATYALSDERLPAAQSIIKLMVQRDFDMMAGADYDAITRTIDKMIATLRWRRL